VTTGVFIPVIDHWNSAMNRGTHAY